MKYQDWYRRNVWGHDTYDINNSLTWMTSVRCPECGELITVAGGKNSKYQSTNHGLYHKRYLWWVLRRVKTKMQELKDTSLEKGS